MEFPVNGASGLYGGMVTRACLRYAREGQNVTQAGPKCHTSRSKMSHKGQNVTQSCYNDVFILCLKQLCVLQRNECILIARGIFLLKNLKSTSIFGNLALD